MRSFVLLLLLLALSSPALGQTRIHFDKFTSHSKDPLTGQVTLDNVVQEMGWLEVNRQNASVTLGHYDDDRQETLTLDVLQEVEEAGHVLGFSQGEPGVGFAFIPEDRLLLLTSSSGGRAFVLSQLDVQRLQREFQGH